MFTTIDHFRIPLPNDAGVSKWRMVILSSGAPFYIATLQKMSKDSTHHYLLGGSDELLEFATSLDDHRFRSLSLLQPPRWSGAQTWTMVQAVEVHREVRPMKGQQPSALILSGDGRCFGGTPVRQLDRRRPESIRLFRLA